MSRILFYTVLFFMFSSCKKYEEEIITGNVAPPDPTIENNIYEDFVNRTYIMVLGREPLASELTDHVNLLKNDRLSIASRETFLNTVFSTIDYRYHLYEENRFNLLRDNDSNDVQLFISLLINALSDSAQMQSWPIYQYEFDRLNLLSVAQLDFVNGNIKISEVQRRMVNNFFYDQINMNSQNFVLAVFQQLINRVPTQNELQGGVAMVDGLNSSVLFQSGSSKEDFLTIVLNADDYFEGQVVLLYQKYLLRLPNSQEMTAGMNLYKSTDDYVKIQIDILKSDEFVKIE